jgi:hypothetical protein
LFLVFNINLTVIGAPGDTTISITPNSQTVETSETFTIEIYCVPSEEIKGFELEISFDSSLVKAIAVSEGNIFEGFPNFFSSGDIDNSKGTITGIYGLIVGQGTTTDPGSFCNISFTSKSKAGTSSISFDKIGQRTGVVNEVGYISIETENGEVKVNESGNPPSPPPEQPPSQPPFTPPPAEEENNPPETPKKPSGPTFVEKGVVYIYETSTFDVDGDNIRFRFDMGDGNFSKWSNYVSSNSTIGVSYTWYEVSNYSVRAIAQDSQGLNSSWSDPITVTVSGEDSGEEPVISISLSNEISTNETIIFDASETFDPDGDIVSYHWDFGDGNVGSNKIQSHVYENPGKYAVKLTVTDNIGYSYSKTITVNIVDSETIVKAKTSKDENSGILNPFIFLIICILIVENIFILFFFRPNLRKSLSNYFIRYHSRILKWYAKWKIERLDSKISRISEKEQLSDFSGSIEPMQMDSSEDSLLQTPIYGDISKDMSMLSSDKTYNSDTYNRNGDEEFDESFETKSFYRDDDEDINSRVDRLILSKTENKQSSDFEKSVERIIDNYKISKGFDSDN